METAAAVKERAHTKMDRYYPGENAVVSSEEFNAMTLQVGLVGTDGFVLASDRLVQRYEYGSRSVSLSSKFMQGPDVVCCHSGDFIAEGAAFAIRSHDWNAQPREKEAIRSVLVALGSAQIRNAETRNELPPGIARKVLIILYSEQLWILELGAGGSFANQVLDRAVAGDYANTCRFWISKYAKDCYQSPVAELVRVAAYTVLAAGEENPHGVNGLEIFVIPRSEVPILLNHTQEKELQDWFNEVSTSIQKQLTRPFGFRSTIA